MALLCTAHIEAKCDLLSHDTWLKRFNLALNPQCCKAPRKQLPTRGLKQLHKGIQLQGYERSKQDLAKRWLIQLHSVALLQGNRADSVADLAKAAALSYIAAKLYAAC